MNALLRSERLHLNRPAALAALTANAVIAVCMFLAPDGHSDGSYPDGECEAYAVSLAPPAAPPAAPEPPAIVQSESASVAEAPSQPFEPSVRAEPPETHTVAAEAARAEPAMSAPAAQAEPRTTGPTNAHPAAGLQSVEGEILADYWATVRSRIAARLRYPPAARRRHAEGVVALKIALDGEGRVRGLEATAEPADRTLTAAALDAARKAAPFGAVPGAVQSGTNAVSAVIRIRFQLVNGGEARDRTAREEKRSARTTTPGRG